MYNGIIHTTEPNKGVSLHKTSNTSHGCIAAELVCYDEHANNIGS
jgi:hypothetical protein